MGEGKKEDVTVVLKIEIHCEGCANKILKSVRTIKGVERARADWEANKLTVKGAVDPAGLRGELQERLGKKVELISPKKDTEKRDASKQDTNVKQDGNKSDDKKPKDKEKGVTTAVLKLSFHCEGCIDKIYKIASRTSGVEDIDIDKKKELLTVTGTVDAKALAESLKEKMNTSVQIVAPKKDKDGGDNGKSTMKEAGGGGGNGMMLEGNMSYGDAAGSWPGFGYPFYNPNPYASGNNMHAPQIFSDENPNACSVM